MLNNDGVKQTKMTAPRQILANIELQSSVGCIVPAELGVAVGGKKIAKAGTPINIDLMNIQASAKAVVEGTPMNAVLLHDVDVTDGAKNGTALVFGFVNVSRVDTDIATAITNARAIEGASNLLTFMKL